jgi:hypothetical protein
MSNRHYTETESINAALAELREMFPKSRCQITISFIEKGGFGVMEFDYAPKIYTSATKDETEIWLMDVRPANSELGLKMRAPTLADCMAQVRKWREESK